MESDVHGLAGRYLAMMESHDLADAASVFADDFRCHFHAAGPAPLDRDGWRVMVGAWFEAFPDLKPTSSRIVADEAAGLAAVQMAWTATHAGPFMGDAPTGRTVHGDGVSVFRAEGGLFVEEWVYEDVARLMSQLA